MRRILTSAELTTLGLGSRTTIWRRSRDPEDLFPAPVEIGPNRVGWYADEIGAFQDNLTRRGPEKLALKSEAA